VGDDVVQLTCNAGALLGDGSARLGCPLPFELRRPLATDPEPRTAPTGDAAVLPAIPATEPADPATSETIERVRGLVPAGVYVSGITAMVDDLTAQLGDTLPVFVAAILAV
jgi:putative drug exporter of the RND superfamily